MKKRILYLAALCCALFAGCNENEILVFDSEPGINFLRYSGVLGWNETSNVGDMYFTRNFGTYINEWNVQTDTVYIRAKLEGKMSDKPLRVHLKYNLNPTDLELIFRDDYQFQSNEYLIEFQIVIKRPSEIDRTFYAGVSFDFENSDVVAGGATDRQVFVLRVSDTFTLETAGLAEETWKNSVEPLLGAYSNVKLRFIAFALQNRILGYLGTSGLTANNIQTINNALEAYNAANPANPLRDENGELVSFEP